MKGLAKWTDPCAPLSPLTLVGVSRVLCSGPTIESLVFSFGIFFLFCSAFAKTASNMLSRNRFQVCSQTHSQQKNTIFTIFAYLFISIVACPLLVLFLQLLQQAKAAIKSCSCGAKTTPRLPLIRRLCLPACSVISSWGISTRLAVLSKGCTKGFQFNLE